MRSYSVDYVRHVSLIRPDDPDMLGTITEVNVVGVNTNWIVELVVVIVAPGHFHQLCLLMAEGDTIPLAVVLGQGEDVAEV